MAVVIETTLGDFTVDLYIEDRPHTCKNFLKLCKMKYYNYCLFHTVQHNFIAQTGDPSGTGKNGESVYGKIHGDEKKFFEAEIMPKIKHTRSGLLSMVNCGNNMLGSQFFLTLGCELQSLDNEHCIFGEVSEGHEILLKLNDVICDTEHRPYQDIRITHTVILEDPFEDPPGLYVPDTSPEPSKETLLNARIAPDEELDETKGRSAAELEEMAREREAKAQATILEIVGDLPDAEIAPPENVLFVCKLNPVTTDDDLEIIFSRFGKVKGCEVIRDKVTGDSLQYAFVEFEEQKACEDAFFKMDNVLIDDRRIHVDFSQSVSKLRWKGKGRGVEHFEGQANTKSARKNSTTLQDHKQSKVVLSKREDKHELGSYCNSSRSGKPTECSSPQPSKQGNMHGKKRGHVKSEHSKKSDEPMNERHALKNKWDKSEHNKKENAQEYIGSGKHNKNKHGNDSLIHKHAGESGYKDYPSSDKRYKDGDTYKTNSNESEDSKKKSEQGVRYQDELGSINRYKDDNTKDTKSRNEKDCHYQKQFSSGKRHRPRDENELGSHSYKDRSEQNTPYQEDFSSRNRYQIESKKGSTSRNEGNISYQEKSSSDSRQRDEHKKNSNNWVEKVVPVYYKEESSLGDRYRDDTRQGSKSRKEKNASYKERSGSPNRYRDENKRGSRPRDFSYHIDSLTSSKYNDKDRREIHTATGGRDSNYRKRTYSGSMNRGDGRRADEHNSRSERDNRDARRYRVYSDIVDPCRNKEGRDIYTRKDERENSYEASANLVDGHGCNDIKDRNCSFEGEEASQRKSTSSDSKRQKNPEYGEKRNVSSNNLARSCNDGGKGYQKDSRVENDGGVNRRTDSRKVDKVDKHEIVQKEKHTGVLLPGENSKSKETVKGGTVKRFKTIKHRLPSSSSSSSDSESSSSSTTSSSSSSDTSSTSSSDSSAKVSRAKRRKRSKKVTSKKQNVKSVRKSTKGKKVKQLVRKPKRKESSSDESSSEGSTSSSSSSDHEQKYVKRSKKIR